MKRFFSVIILLALLLSLGELEICLHAEAAMATSGYLEYSYSGYTAVITDCANKAVGYMSIPSTLSDKTVVSIKEYAFQNCIWIQGFEVPDTVRDIGQGAFMSCSNAVQITLPAGLTSISESMFQYCSSLRNIIMGSQITQIKNFAFSGCSSLTEFIIPYGVATIGDEAFASCTSLETIVIPDTVTTIGKDVFINCDNLTRIVYCGTEAQWNEIYVKGTNTVLRSVDRQYHLPAGGTCTTSPTCAICGEIAGDPLGHSYADGVCTLCNTPMTVHVTLTGDMILSGFKLTEDLYIDLNGHDLSGRIITNGFKIYGMDSATDKYSCDNLGFFACVDENGKVIVPESLYTTGDAKRYMTIDTESGYTFHRFYLGVTKLSLDAVAVGVGYKAEFYGDKMVQSQVASIGYNLWITEDRVISHTTAYKNSLTLRLKNFDVANYGDVPVHACVTIALTNGTVITGATHSSSLRQVVEAVNHECAKYTASQLGAVYAMIQANPVMQTWLVGNINKKF